MENDNVKIIERFSMMSPCQSHAQVFSNGVQMKYEQEAHHRLIKDTLALLNMVNARQSVKRLPTPLDYG
jgi:hypothetical protein